jgi:hypothetical protein
MLKYLFFTLIFCVSTPCFCGSNQAINTTFTFISSENRMDKKVQKVFSKQAFLTKIRLGKQFPFFGVVSIIASLLGAALLMPLCDYIAKHPWLSDLGVILSLAGIGLGITGLLVGEFALWSLLGIGLVPFIIFMLLAINGTGSC